MEILAYIQYNPNWEQQFAEAPYFIRTKREGGFELLKYKRRVHRKRKKARL